MILIEARERIGGRVHTDTSLGPERAYDAGAQYIHWAERNPWKPIADALGASLKPDRTGVAPSLYVDGRRASDEERRRRSALFGRLTPELTLHGRSDRSIRAAVAGGGPELEALAMGVTRLSLGEEADRVSLADYDRLWDGDDELVPEGYGHLVARYYHDLPVRLGVTAQAIDASGSGVRVETDRGTLRAAAVIVTVSVGVLQAGAIRVMPGWPDAHRDALAGLGMGAYTKIALALDPTKLPELRAGDVVSVHTVPGAEPGPTMIFEMMPFGRPVAVATCGGDYARGLCMAGEGAALADATERLVAILGGAARGAVLGGRLAGWWTDPFSRGGYSVARPGHADARERLQLPIADRLLFAGEATAGGGAMTVGGATLEGRRAAAEVVRMLRA